jgi:hypothetical protein
MLCFVYSQWSAQSIDLAAINSLVVQQSQMSGANARHILGLHEQLQ